MNNVAPEARPPSGAENVLELEALSSGYQYAPVLERVSIRVRVGEAVSVLGPNGAGKTTLLRTVSGLLNIDSGRITIGGRDTTRFLAHQVARLGVAHVPEGRALFPSLTLQDNLTLGGLAGGAAARDAGMLATVLDLFPWMKARLRAPAGMLSGGQQQMVAIGRGLMGKPRLLLLDEPSLGLAPKVIDEVYSVLARIKESGVAMLIVEQNARYGMSFAHYVYVLNRGRVVTSGPPSELDRGGDFENAYFHGQA